MLSLSNPVRLVRYVLATVTHKSVEAPRFGHADEGKWALLAGLRFFLAAIVVLHHLNHIGRELPLQFPTAEAVWGFLLISGYSIAASIEKNPNGFYVRRAIRIYPAYLTAITICAFLSIGAVALKGKSISPALFAAYLPFVFMMQAFFVATPFALGPAWTLSCEWLYYMFAPLIDRRDSLITVLMSVSAIAVAVHPWSVTGALWHEIYGVPAICMAWAWLAGYYIYRKGCSLPFGVACVALFQYSNASPFGGAVFVVSLVAVAGNFSLKGCIGNFASYLGDLSYVVYIIHVPVYLVAEHALQSIRYGVTEPLLFVAGATLLVYHGIDKPLHTALTSVTKNDKAGHMRTARKAESEPAPAQGVG